jgi:hypothetical protein
MNSISGNVSSLTSVGLTFYEQLDYEVYMLRGPIHIDWEIAFTMQNFAKGYKFFMTKN